jgi:tetratricopeptide (TPR) repeat protein
VAVINTTGANAASSDDRQRQLELATFHAARAAELDPSLAWFPGSVGNFNVWRWSEALGALESAPANSLLDTVSIWLFSLVGDHEQATRRARRSVELDPRNWNRYWALGVALAYRGEADEAVRVLRDGIALAPTAPVLRSWLAFVEIARGETAAAAAELERAEQLLAQNRQAVFLPELAYSYSRIGRSADVERIAAEVERLPEGTGVGTGGWAMIYLARNEREKAIEQLQAALVKIENHEIDEGFWNLMNIRMNTTADPVLEEPEFVALRERLRGN